ncbi:MAG: hypothetical protein LCH61_09610 [Proteobacteria bacterium]|nr:hypothetical protein [Pseudomonadota bacterium]
MSDFVDMPQERLRARDIEDICGFRLPTAARFSLTHYNPPGPVASAYIQSMGPIDAITGPGGSGKTVASIFKGIRFSIASMPVCRDHQIRVKGTVVRDNYRSLYRTTLQSWFDYFPVSQHPEFFGGQDRPATHKLRLSTVRVIDGIAREIPVDLQVDFFAIQDINYELAFKSYETSWGWATEADGIPVAAIPFFYSRTARYPRMDMLPEGTVRPRIMQVDFNPPDPNHPLWEACERGSFKTEFNPERDVRTVNFFRQPSGLSARAENRAGKSLAEYQAEYDALPRDEARRMVEGLPGRVKDGLPVYDDEWDYDTFVSKVPVPIDPDLPKTWRAGQGGVPMLKPIAWKNKPLASSAHMAAVKYQLTRLSRRRPTSPGVSPVWALACSQLESRRRARQYRRWIGRRAA